MEPLEQTAKTTPPHRWPVIQEHALRNAVIGFVLIATVFILMQVIATRYDVNVLHVQLALGGASLFFSLMFCSLAEHLFEDAMKPFVFLILGGMMPDIVQLPWALTPGLAMTVATIANATSQRVLGRPY